MKNREDLLCLCKQHDQMYTHYCRAVGCRRLLCIKCVDPHKLFHSSSASIATCLAVHDLFLSDIELYHDKLKKFVATIAMAGPASVRREKTGKVQFLVPFWPQLEKRKETIDDAIGKIEKLAVEIAECARQQQNSRVGDRYGKFRRLKKAIARDLKRVIDVLVAVDSLHHTLVSLRKDLEFNMVNLDLTTHSVTLMDPVSSTRTRFAVPERTSLSPNAQTVLSSQSIYILNGAIGDLIEARLSDGPAAKLLSGFTPRSDLLSRYAAAFGLVCVMNVFLYAVGEESCQKYCCVADSWSRLPKLRVKGNEISVCLVSDRIIYAVRRENFGTLMIETLDLLDEDRGWSFIMTRPNTMSDTEMMRNVRFPAVERMMLFQQDNAGVIVLANATVGGQNTMSMYVDANSGRLSMFPVKVPSMRVSSEHQVKELGRMLSFVEDDYYRGKRVWLYDKQRKRFSLSYEYDSETK